MQRGLSEGWMRRSDSCSVYCVYVLTLALMCHWLAAPRRRTVFCPEHGHVPRIVRFIDRSHNFSNLTTEDIIDPADGAHAPRLLHDTCSHGV